MMKIMKQYIPLCVVVIFAFLLRVVWLNVIPVSTYIDETAIGLDAYMIATTGKDMHGNSALSPIIYSYGDYKMPVYIWSTVPWVMLLGRTMMAIRMSSVLAGCISVILVYFISLELFFKHKKKHVIALFSSFILAVMPWSILFSRTGFEGHLAQMFVLCMILFGLRSHKNGRNIILSSMFGVIAMYTYFSVRYVALPLFVGSILLGFILNKVKKQKYIQAIPTVVIGLLIFGASFIPMMKSPLYGPSQQLRLSSKNILDQQGYVEYSNMLMNQDKNSVISKIIHHRYLYLVKTLVSQYATYVTPEYVFFSGDSNLRHSTQAIGILLPVTSIFLVCGAYALYKRHKIILLFFFVWWLFAVLPAAVPVEVPHALRSINAMGVFPIILGLGVYELIYFLKKNMIGRVIIVLIAVGLVVNLGFFLSDYIYEYPKRSASAWSDGYIQVSREVGEKWRSYDHIYVSGGQKILLWVMYYGGFSPKEIQECVHSADAYIFDSATCLNISFNTPDWKKEIQGKQTVFIVGDKETISPLPGFVEHELPGIYTKGVYATFTKEK